MRVLLDECLPRRLRAELRGHHVRTVPEMGWAGVQNGELLRLAAPTFDVLLTVGQRDQISTGSSSVRDIRHCIVLRAHSNDISPLMPLVPAVVEALSEVEPGRAVEIRI